MDSFANLRPLISCWMHLPDTSARCILGHHWSILGQPFEDHFTKVVVSNSVVVFCFYSLITTFNKPTTPIKVPRVETAPNRILILALLRLPWIPAPPVIHEVVTPANLVDHRIFQY